MAGRRREKGLGGGDIRPLSVAAASEPYDLRSPDVGLRVIRGGTVRALGYGLGMALTAVASVFLLRYLGVADFGRYMTVASLIAIVSGVTDAGLTAVGSRDLALRAPGEERRRLLANLLGLRLFLTPLGVLAATAFALVAHYDDVLIWGTLLAGLGLILTSAQGTMALPLAVELRIGRLTAVEILKQAVMLVGIAVLVAAGASLLPFFAVYIAIGVVALAVTVPTVGRGFVWRPAFDRVEWRSLIREALPIAASLVMNVIYFRVLILLMSLLAIAVETGLFATSFRVFEILFGISSLVVTVALPVLAVVAEDRARLRYMLQRMLEIATMAACYLALLVIIVAEPALELLGGSEYRDAAPVLRIQILALIPVFFSQVWQVGLISIKRQSGQAAANGFALVLVVVLGLALIPLYDASGAAVAALLAETGLALALLFFLIRSDPALRPSFGFIWKIVLAAGLAATTLAVPGLPPLLAAAISTAIYVATLLLTHAVPREVIDASLLRKTG